MPRRSTNANCPKRSIRKKIFSSFELQGRKISKVGLSWSLVNICIFGLIIEGYMRQTAGLLQAKMHCSLHHYKLPVVTVYRVLLQFLHHAAFFRWCILPYAYIYHKLWMSGLCYLNAGHTHNKMMMMIDVLRPLLCTR